MVLVKLNPVDPLQIFSNTLRSLDDMAKIDSIISFHISP